MLALVASRKLQILYRRLLRFLNESVQQDHPASPVDIKKHPRDSVLAQFGSHLVDAIAQRPANRHTDRPAKLHRFYVLADPLSILSRGQIL